MATIAIAIAIFLSAIANILVGTMSKILYYLIKFDSCTPLSSDIFLTFSRQKSIQNQIIWLIIIQEYPKVVNRYTPTFR